LNAESAAAHLDERLARTDASEVRDLIADAIRPFVAANSTLRHLPLRPLIVEDGTCRRVARQVKRAGIRLERLIEGDAQHRYVPGDLDVVRPDGVLDGHGSFTMFEMNAGSCVGGLVEVESLSRVMEPWVTRVLAGSRVRFPYPLRALARSLMLRYGTGARFAWTVLPGALSTDWGGPLAAATTQAMRAQGLAVEAVETDRLEVNRSGARFGGRRVDVIIRVIDALDWDHDERLASLREAVSRGAVRLFSSAHDRRYANKGALVELSLDGAALLPWTRHVRPALEGGRDLLPFIREHAAEYVLKPCWGRQGQRVVIGREDTALFGQLLVASVISGDCIVQRYVEPPTAALPFLDGRNVVTRHARIVVSALLTLGSPPGLCARTSTLEQSAVLTHPALDATGLVPVAEILSRHASCP
jgi:hypothetical protein